MWQYNYSDELYHFGVKGMRWGVHRKRESAGTAGSLTKKQMRKEFKMDNKKAFELGRRATGLGRAFDYGAKKTIKLENKIDKAYKKDPNGLKRSTQKKVNEWQKHTNALSLIGDEYQKTHAMAKKHVAELNAKYGKENVKGIKYKEFSNERMGNYKRMNERVVRGRDVVASILLTVGSHVVPTPVGVISVPRGKASMGVSIYRNAKSISNRKQRRKSKWKKN